ncbi:MAG: thiamine-phosphate kinase [Actinomycetaceae bacterium]|nr:thiamine-phosphate kinase [Actinomycetaceae bacterium]
MTVKVAQCSEAQILTAIKPYLSNPPGTLVPTGDDCAVIAAPDSRYAITTDVLVEDSHWLNVWSTPYQVGRRAAAQNLADIAAMGAVPTAMVCALVMRPDVELAWVTEFARGLGEATREAGAGVVGGDLARGKVGSVAITVCGDLQGRAPVLRSGARAGDVVAVAGTLGHSAAGLDLLYNNMVPPAASDWPEACQSQAELMARVRAALDIYLAPSPPLLAGVDAAIAGAHAMMDISDGLDRDAGRMASASGVVIDLDPKALRQEARVLQGVAGLLEGLPYRATSTLMEGVSQALGAQDSAARDRSLSWVLSGGEDHPMLATFSPEVELPASFRAIGTVTVPNSDMPAGSVSVAGVPITPRGWDHFKKNE